MKTGTGLLLMLAVLCAAGGLYSCGESTPSPSADTKAVLSETESVTESGNVPSSPRDRSDLPEDYDLEGFTLRVVAQTNAADGLCRLAAESESGEKLNDTIYARNQRMMEKYHFSITESNVDDLTGEVRRLVTAGDDVYDTAVGWACSYAGSVVTENILYNLYDLENLNLSKNYWDQNLTQALTVGRRLYLACGDILVQDSNESMMVILYNRSLAEDLDIENLYEVADRGAWTMERMIAEAKAAVSDLNGDNKINEKDRMGYLYCSNNCIYPYLAAGNTSITGTDAEGKPVLLDKLDRAVQVCDVSSVLYDGGFSAEWSVMPDVYTTLPNLVSNKQVLFQNMNLSILRRLYRDVTAEFGILPMPKLDESQEEYGTSVWRDFEAVTVLTTTGQPAKTGFVLEALASDSYELNQTYFDICLQSKYTRDEESYKNCMMMLDHVRYDISFIFNFGTFYDALNREIQRGGASANIMSTIEKNKGKYESAVAAFLENLD